MSTTTGNVGGNPPPNPPPGGGGADRPGASGTPQKGKRQRRSSSSIKPRGRPLQSAERTLILNIWYQLSTSARRSLWENLGGMLGETPAGATAVATASEPAVAVQPPTSPIPRLHAWERPILKDIPLFCEFGQLTNRERREDQRDIPRLISIAQGVIARGRRAGVADGDITYSIIQHIYDPEALKQLYSTLVEPVGDPHDGDKPMESS